MTLSKKYTNIAYVVRDEKSHKSPTCMLTDFTTASCIRRLTLASLLLALTLPVQAQPASDLPAFFKEWRAFERPPMRDGAPDYTAETFNSRYKDYLQLRKRLDAMDTTGWSMSLRVLRCINGRLQTMA